MGRRIDVVLLTKCIVFVVEFKVGYTAFERAAIDQVWDYALDLKNFHEASHSASIIPILVATGANATPPIELCAGQDKVYKPIRVHSPSFRATLELVLQSVTGATLEEQLWSRAPYHPTPTIVEAARRYMLSIPSRLSHATTLGHRIFESRPTALKNWWTTHAHVSASSFVSSRECQEPARHLLV